MKCKKKKIIWKRIINKNGNKLIDFIEKEQVEVNSFHKVKERLNKQENLEDLELLADIACQQEKIKFEAVAQKFQEKRIHWKKEIININNRWENQNIPVTKSEFDNKNDFSI
ncbi:hypothetical protein [Spiroplasma endosymbiont of Polydrusus pterygomalis]|uniref:hypothetical protein n=1 Tax=Spiroplasma endosymbiont of Polydrusus pterygomalis TaxID=3139327 RepID=UPI003CCAA2AE